METIQVEERTQIPSERADVVPPPSLPLDISREHGSYSGYIPRATTDFISQTTASTSRRLKEDNLTRPPTLPSPPIKPDDRQTSALPIAIIGLFIVATIAVVIIAASPAGCALSLCSKHDRSSLASTLYLFKPFDFTAPLITLLSSLVCPFLAIAFLYVIIRLVTSTKTAEQPVATFSTHVKHTAVTFFQFFAFAICFIAVPIFILSGFASSWATAASVIFGIFPTLIAAFITLATSTQVAPRIVTALRTSVLHAFTIAFRAAFVGPLAAVALTFSSLVIAYLIVRDVRALVGYVLGSSAVALILRTVSVLFSYHRSAVSVSRFGQNDARHPAAPLPSAGAHIASSAALAAQMCATFAAPIVATAILGSSLPYFESSPYALCVLNHLSIDDACVSYHKPNEKQSFAATLCRGFSLHTSYPTLSALQSNSLFVALPFLLAVNVTVGAVIAAVFSLIEERDQEGRLNPADTSTPDKPRIRPLLLSGYMRVAVRFLVSSVGAIIICFVMFGGSSPFHKIHSTYITRYRLPTPTNSNARVNCAPVSAPNADLDTDIFPRLERESTPYRPLDPFGVEYPPATSTAWRLFLCIEVGMICGLCIGGFCSFMSSSLNAPTLRVSAMADDTLGNEVVASLGAGVLAAILSAFGITATSVICYALFRSYGVGIGAIGLLHFLAHMGALSMMSHLSKEVRRICEICVEGVESTLKADLMVAAGGHLEGWSKSVLTVCSIMGAMAVAWVDIEQAGMIPSAREVAGFSIMNRPSRHSTDLDRVNLLEMAVMIAVIIGILLPIIVCAAVTYSTSRVSWKMSRVIAREMKKRGTWERSELVNFGRCRESLTRITSEETVLPVSLALLAGFLGGLWFGRRGWIGVVAGALSSGAILSLTLAICGSRLEGIRVLHTEWNGEKRKDRMKKNYCGNENGSEWKWEECSQEWVSGCVSTFLLFLTSSAAVGMKAMPIDGRRWWSGVIVFAVWIWIMMTWMAYVVKKDKSATEKNDKDDIENATGTNECRVNVAASSPFYEGGPSIPRGSLSPRSALRHWQVDDLSDLETLLK